jgi:RecQ mediated genome instability protein
MMITQDAACRQLQETAGVRPSRTWIRDAQRAGVEVRSAEELLQHILYQELRHVVREEDDQQQQDNPSSAAAAVITSIGNHHAQDYRRILQSHHDVVRNNNNNNNSNNLREATMLTTLPESFKLMIQVEEVVDVAQAAEARLGGNASTAMAVGQQQQHHQQQRCLKLCITDGYHDHPQPKFAMELSNIPNLSAQTPAGTKLLLHGPIPIRWGVLLLHQGNALVLGGSVARLVELQNEALADAKKQTGVGVDPTVRALVWNPDMGDEEGTSNPCFHGLVLSCTMQ